MSTQSLIDVILPVFGLIAIGYLIVRLGLIGEEIGDALAAFIFKISLPLLLFRTLATLGWPDISPWPFWLTYFSGVAIVWGLAALTMRHVFRRDARTGVVAGISSGYSNLVLLGIPVVNQAFGQDGLVVILVLITVHLAVMMTVSEILTEAAERKDGLKDHEPDLVLLVRRVGGSLALNPFILGMAAGIAYNLSGLPFTGVAADLVDRIAGIAIPTALLSLGMGMKKYGVRGSLLPAAAIAALKLLVLPVSVFLIARYVTQLSPLYTSVVTIAASCPTGVNAYLIANRVGTGQALAATAITLTTAISVVAIGVWLTVLGV